MEHRPRREGLTYVRTLAAGGRHPLSADGDLADERAKPHVCRITMGALVPAHREVDGLARRRAFETTQARKLLLTFQGTGGITNAPGLVEWAVAQPAFEVRALGPAGHHAPEDAPAEIAAAISTWLER